jgi:DNA-binding NtrC family response regulator
VAALTQHPWPGNIRELRNTLERAFVLGKPVSSLLPTSDSQVEPVGGEEALDLDLEIDPDLPFREGKRQVVRAYEDAYIRIMLVRCKGNITEVARRAGLERVTVYRLIERANAEAIRRGSKRAGSRQEPDEQRPNFEFVRTEEGPKIE